jgi:hypothetical protein
MPPTKKAANGQFYTARASYILEGLAGPPPTTTRVLEPFAGAGDLLSWLTAQGYTGPVEAYDIDPKTPAATKRDTLLDPPEYAGAWVLTNPPYLARNKSPNKAVYDRYDTNDLYKAFLLSLITEGHEPAGGILIIPVGFFLSPRDLDLRVRAAFLSRFRITAVRYFEETVFPDTPTTVVAFSFVLSAEALTEQAIPWTRKPDGAQQTFTLRAADGWIIGGDIYKLTIPPAIKIRRHVEGQVLREGEQLTGLTLTALDSGTADGRICLTHQPGYVYPAKDTSRSFATLCIQGRVLTEAEQVRIAAEFNAFLEERRTATWSLFLPQYRESKEYARKRIPFELAYALVGWIIGRLNPSAP